MNFSAVKCKHRNDGRRFETAGFLISKQEAQGEEEKK